MKLPEPHNIWDDVQRALIAALIGANLVFWSAVWFVLKN